MAPTAPFLGIAALTSLVLLLAAPAHATTVLRFDIEAHVAESTAVVEATVGSSEQIVDAEYGRPFTYTTISVESVLHGRVPTSLAVRQMRGIVDGQATFVPGDGELRPGARVVLFLSHNADGYWYLTALAQSVYEVKGSSSDPAVGRQLRDLAILERDAEGRLVPAGDHPEPTRLSQLRAAIAAAVEDL